MYKYLIAFVLSMPLIGIWLVEHGEYAMTLGLPGERNGASAAFAFYAVVVVVVSLLSSGQYGRHGPRALSARQRVMPRVIDVRLATRRFRHFATNLLWLNGVFLLAMLFGFGGIDVWFGTVEKGLFRANLGPLGAVAYLMTKFAIPVLFAYATLLLLNTPQRRGDKWLWRANAVLVVLVGSTWGFKTTGVFMLLPGLLLLNWNLSLPKFLALATAFFGSLVFFFYVFDAQIMEDVDALSFLFTRLTVLQGDVAWYVWGLYSHGDSLPNYWPTLLAAIGDTPLTIFGVSRENYPQWMAFHYDWMITFLSGAPFEQIANGHSITATPFAEGVIAAGSAGFLTFGALAGFLVGRTYAYIARAIVRGRMATAAVLATYFCFHLFAWLYGGAVTQLFHVSVLVNIGMSVLLLRVMSLRPRSNSASPALQTAQGQLATT